MGYIGTNRQKQRPQVVKPQKASPLAIGSTLFGMGTTTAKLLNERKERVLKETGDLDKTISYFDDEGEGKIFKVFERKPSPKGIKGLFAPPEKSIQLTSDARDYFESQALASGNTPGEELRKYIIDNHGENSRLLKVAHGGEKHWEYGGTEKLTEMIRENSIVSDPPEFRDSLERLNFDELMDRKYTETPRKGFNPEIEDTISVSDRPQYDENKFLSEYIGWGKEGELNEDLLNRYFPPPPRPVREIMREDTSLMNAFPLQEIDANTGAVESADELKRIWKTNRANENLRRQKYWQDVGNKHLGVPTLELEPHFLEDAAQEGMNILDAGIEEPIADLLPDAVGKEIGESVAGNVIGTAVNPGGAVASALGLAGPLGWLAGAAANELFEGLFS